MTLVIRLTTFISIYTPSILDRAAWANSLDPDQMLQKAASDPDLHCLSLIQSILNIPTSNEIKF